MSFVSDFNILLGNKLGSPISEPPVGSFAVNSAARRENELKAFAIESLLKDRAQKKKSSKTTDDNKLKSVDLAKQLTKVENADQDHWWNNPILDNPVTRTALEAGSRALDVVSRPAYGLFEGLKERSESLNEQMASNPDRNWIEAEARSLDNVIGGMWSGISGKEKTMFKDVISENAKRNVSTLPGPLGVIDYGVGINKLKEEHKTLGDVAWWSGAVAGEIGLDPTNYIGVGAIAKLKHAGKGADAVRGFEDLAKSVAKTKAAGLGLNVTRTRFTRVGTTSAGKGIVKNVNPVVHNLDTIVEDAADSALLTINKGAVGGRVYGVHTAPGVFASKITEGIRGEYFKEFDNAVATFKTALLNKKSLSPADYASLKLNPEFQRVVGDVLDQIVTLSPKNAAKWPKIFDNAVDGLKRELDDQFAKMQDDIFTDLAGQLFNVPTLKIVGKEVPLTRLGGAYYGFRDAKLSSKALKTLSHSKQFEGRAALIAQKIRSAGHASYETLHKEAVKLARTMSKEERMKIQDAILKGYRLSDPKLEAARTWISNEYERILAQEVEAGIRKAEGKAHNYAYVYYKGKNSKAIDLARKQLKISVQDTKRINPDLINPALKPEMDAFKALLYRQIKSNKSLGRSWYMQDLLNHYGVASKNLSAAGAASRKLIPVQRMPLTTKAALGVNEKWYLPQDIHEFYQNFLDISRSSYAGTFGPFLKNVDALTRMFKTSVTIPFPGFHIKNAMGDMFMSSLDGVNPKDYASVLNAIRRTKLGAATKFNIGGTDFTFEELLDFYRKNAASGGFNVTDLQEGLLRTTRPGDAIRAVSEKREDFFRFTHFLHAFKEEYPATLSKLRNKDKALQTAIESSSMRVNKYLFDYGALTAAEKNVLRRLIPFYTYSRKVMPTLAESLLLSPRNLAVSNRIFEQNDLEDMAIPDYIREIGYAPLRTGDEPFVLRADALPTAVFKDLLDVKSMENVSENVIKQLHPVPKMIAELAGGESSFSNQEIDSTGQYVQDSLFPPIKTTMDLFKPGDKTLVEKLLSNRWGLGLPIDRISDQQQKAAEYGIQQEAFDIINTYNDDLKKKGLRAYLSDRKNGASFKVANPETGDVLFETTDPNKFIQYLKQL